MNTTIIFMNIINYEYFGLDQGYLLVNKPYKEIYTF